ncbi:MAG: hypothetical protein GXO78_13675 [Calditrichaeota bacterium]|nr:hypothetical protein [Calditrichota bacterium]
MPAHNQKILGFFLVFAGLLLLVLQYQEIDWYFIRSYGFLMLGAAGLWRTLFLKSPRGVYLSSFLFLLGGYFLLAEWGLYEISRGLNISVITLFLGIGFYFLFFFKARNWEYLIVGNLVIIMGLLFLLRYLGLIPSRVLVRVVDDYWPVFLIIIGLALIIQSVSRSRKVSPSHQSDLPSRT